MWALVMVMGGMWAATVVGGHQTKFMPCIKPKLDCDLGKIGMYRDVDKIIGGLVADPGSTPWLVSLQDTQYHEPVHFCGGSILTRNWILTSAACVSSYQEPFENIQVVAGEYDLNALDGWEVVKEVSGVVLHPKYDHFSHDGDAALLRLAGQLRFNERLQPLPLPYPKARRRPPGQDGEFFLGCLFSPQFMVLCRRRLTGCGVVEDSLLVKKKKWTFEAQGSTEIGTASSEGVSHRGRTSHTHPFQDLHLIAGWGVTAEVSEMSHLVLVAYVPVLSREECSSAYPELFTQTMICAGNLTHGGLDPCQGDWGGALVDSDGYLSGVSSWSIGCGRPGFPGVYTDVIQILDWILNVTGVAYDSPSQQQEHQQHL